MRNVQYRSVFEPVAGTGSLILLNQNSGIFYEDDGSAFYEVRHVEAIPLLGQHGVIVVWSDTAVPTGYTADQNATIAHIASGAVQATNGPLNSLVFPKRMLAQVRFRAKWFASVTGAVDDYDITIQAPAGTPRWRAPKVVGVLNAMQQVQDPGDSIVAPAQGSNITLPAAFPGLDPFDIAAMTELFCYGGNSAQVSIQNNGAGATSGGAIGLEMSLFLYNLRQIPIDSNAVDVNLLGETVKVPTGVDLNQVAIVDITGAPIPAAS